jgi:hypothetical protein
LLKYLLKVQDETKSLCSPLCARREVRFYYREAISELIHKNGAHDSAADYRAKAIPSVFGTIMGRYMSTH